MGYKQNNTNPRHRLLGGVDPSKTIGVTRNSVRGRLRDAFDQDAGHARMGVP
jgi:RNase P protein component